MRLTGLLFLLLAAPAFAAGKAPAKPAQKKAPPAPAPAAVAASTAAFAWTSTAPLSVEAVLAHFEAMDAAMVSLKARFTQSLTMAETGVTSRVEGTVAFKKPERLRIEHNLPERQTVVSDGKDIWIHRIARNQVVQSALVDWKKADPAVSNLMEFGSYSRMLKAYDVSLDSAAATLVLVPKSGESKRALVLRMTLDPATLFPSATELKVGSLTVRTEFLDAVFNPVLDEKLFAFTPPADADVFRDFKPPRFGP